MTPSTEPTRSLSVGFTGTRQINKITGVQREAFRNLIISLQPAEFHHGDCIGADSRAHLSFLFLRDISEEIPRSSRIIIHPPTNNTYRAGCDGDVMLPEKPYMQRNVDIVNASDVMIAMPGERPESVWTAKGGTFATIRMSLKAHKLLFILWPDGKVDADGCYPSDAITSPGAALNGFRIYREDAELIGRMSEPNSDVGKPTLRSGPAQPTKCTFPPANNSLTKP